MVRSTRVRFTARVRDYVGARTSTAVDACVDGTVTEAQLANTWAAWAAALDAISDGIVTGGRITTARPDDPASTFWPHLEGAQPPGLKLEQTPSGLKTGTSPREARLAQTALFNFGIIDSSYSVMVPAFSSRFLRHRHAPGGPIDLDAESMQAFIRLLSEPFAAGHGVFTDPHGRPLVGEQRRFRHVALTTRTGYNKQYRRLTTRPGQ